MYTITAPTHWAPRLINGDGSGYERDELAVIDTFARSVEGGIVDCDTQPFFTRYHDAWRVWPFACEAFEYTVV